VAVVCESQYFGLDMHNFASCSLLSIFDMIDQDPDVG